MDLVDRILDSNVVFRPCNRHQVEQGCMKIAEPYTCQSCHVNVKQWMEVLLPRFEIIEAYDQKLGIIAHHFFSLNRLTGKGTVFMSCIPCFHPVHEKLLAKQASVNYLRDLHEHDALPTPVWNMVRQYVLAARIVCPFCIAL